MQDDNRLMPLVSVESSNLLGNRPWSGGLFRPLPHEYWGSEVACRQIDRYIVPITLAVLQRCKTLEIELPYLLDMSINHLINDIDRSINSMNRSINCFSVYVLWFSVIDGINRLTNCITWPMLVRAVARILLLASWLSFLIFGFWSAWERKPDIYGKALSLRELL